jgi:RNA polymerase sigma-70 factor (ECF subfamily)
MLVVLERLTPAERVAFVLHDMFDLPFEEIARILGRSPDAARQLASRARRRVRGADHAAASGDLARQRDVARAYLDAARRGDLASLLAVLAPDVVLHRDPVLVPGGPTEVRGARTVAGGALAHARRARNAVLALVNGSPGIVLAPFGRLSGALAFTFEGDRIVRMDLVADPERLRALEIATLDE